MPTPWWRHQPILWGLLLTLWGAQLGWLAWHFAPETYELGRKVLGVQTGVGSGAGEDPLEPWLTELADLLPPNSTYIFVDCYETGTYAKVRYYLHPRRQIRLDPKTTPAFLFEEIKKEGVTYLILGGCNLAPQWQFLFQGDHPFDQVGSTAGAGLVFRLEPGRVTGGFYD